MNRYHNQKRRKKVYLIKLFSGIISICAIVGILMFAGYSPVKAKEQKEAAHYKYYKSIELKAGDTLWDIAQEYKNEESIKEYIHNIKEINHLTSDDITACSYLTIAYYDTEFH